MDETIQLYVVNNVYDYLRQVNGNNKLLLICLSENWKN